MRFMQGLVCLNIGMLYKLQIESNAKYLKSEKQIDPSLYYVAKYELNMNLFDSLWM